MHAERSSPHQGSPLPAASLTALAGAVLLAVTLIAAINGAAFWFLALLTELTAVLLLVTGLAFGNVRQRRLGLLLLWAHFGLLLGLMLLALFSVGALLMASVFFVGFGIVRWPRLPAEPVVTPLALLLHVFCFAAVGVWLLIWWG